MSRKNYSHEEDYRFAKRKEYLRYYKSTQLYRARPWTDNEDRVLIVDTPHVRAMQLSKKLQRSIKSIEHRKRKLRKQGLLPQIPKK